MEKEKEYSFRVISNQVRFGCGFRCLKAGSSILPGMAIRTGMMTTLPQRKSPRQSIGRLTENIRRKSSLTEKQRNVSGKNM